MADPRRRQLAHIAVLDIAMAVREALERGGLTEAEIARATEEISAFLTGESGALPDDLAEGRVADLFAEILEATSQRPAFAGVFGSPASGS